MSHTGPENPHYILFSNEANQYLDDYIVDNRYTNFDYVKEGK